MLYDAVVKGNVELLDDFLQSQDLLLLDGVTIGGSTVLHIVASSNRDLTWQRTIDNVDFAREVYLRNRSLLMARNKLRETPLHCAAKAGNYRMVSRLISFAEEEDQAVKQTLLTARNIHGETALHEAVRVGHGNIVNKLILSEPSITGIDDTEGVSPLYLATMMNALDIVEIFTKEEPSRVSCAGPKGQTALHVAVLEYSRIVCPLLEWNKSLATEVDDMKSTPLHYAASVGNLETVKLLLGDDEIKKAAYMADKNGLFPIHTAAKCGKSSIIKELIKQFPDSDELLDTQGRNVLHLAILSGKGYTIVRMGHNHTFLRMLNARDYQGNTPLHLAGERRQYRIVRFLISMKMVYSSIMNRNGLTPVDLALKQTDQGIGFIMGREINILQCMMWTGSLPSPRRADHIHDDLQIPKIDEERDQKEKVQSITQNLAVISALIATVTFAAIFTMPGGYIADDHMNRGTPILSRKYAFKAFIVADSLAFLLSTFVTALLIFAGSGLLDIELRFVSLFYSIWLMVIASRATICAFALAIYTILYQVNLGISILVFVASFGLLPFSNPAIWGFLSLVPPIVKRIGWRGLYNPSLGPWTSMHNTIGNAIRGSFSAFFIGELLQHIYLYGLIFGLAAYCNS
ncbi:protein ACCELERATED CELL DEATH 6-like [Carex rostrata]